MQKGVDFIWPLLSNALTPGPSPKGGGKKLKKEK